jgi:hypothetical protein
MIQGHCCNVVGGYCCNNDLCSVSQQRSPTITTVHTGRVKAQGRPGLEAKAGERRSMGQSFWSRKCCGLGASENVGWVNNCVAKPHDDTPDLGDVRVVKPGGFPMFGNPWI